MHKLAYAEFSQDGGLLLKFVKHFRKVSEQLNAMDKQKYEIKYPLVSLTNTDNKKICCHCPLRSCFKFPRAENRTLYKEMFLTKF
jgi:hypothetical protein